MTITRDFFADKVDDVRTWYINNEHLINRLVVVGALMGGVFGIGYSLGLHSKKVISSAPQTSLGGLANGSYAVFFSPSGQALCSAEINNVQSVDTI